MKYIELELKMPIFRKTVKSARAKLRYDEQQAYADLIDNIKGRIAAACRRNVVEPVRQHMWAIEPELK